MIESLNGIHETINYHDMRGIQLYVNVETENYPIHWHTALEIIMPIENSYNIKLEDQVHTVQEGDIFITAPGTLHQLLAPESGKRLIMLVDYSLICTVKGMSSLLHTIQPYTCVTKSASPALSKQLVDYLDQIIVEYQDTNPYREVSIYSLLIQFFVVFKKSNY